MIKLSCSTKSYAWGKFGSNSLVGQIVKKNLASEGVEESKDFEETPFAEYWMGDHVNGPSQFKVTDADSLSWLQEPEFVEANQGKMVNISELLALNEAKFLGEGYAQKYVHAK